MSESEKPFTVNDRRHFTAEGDVREETPEAPEPAVAEAPGEAGAPPPLHYIDPLMRHLGHPYYVGLLSAARLHDRVAGPRERWLGGARIPDDTTLVVVRRAE